MEPNVTAESHVSASVDVTFTVITELADVAAKDRRGSARRRKRAYAETAAAIPTVRTRTRRCGGRILVMGVDVGVWNRVLPDFAYHYSTSPKRCKVNSSRP